MICKTFLKNNYSLRKQKITSISIVKISIFKIGNVLKLEKIRNFPMQKMYDNRLNFFFKFSAFSKESVMTLCKVSTTFCPLFILGRKEQKKYLITPIDSKKKLINQVISVLAIPILTITVYVIITIFEVDCPIRFEWDEPIAKMEKEKTLLVVKLKRK